MSPRRLRAPASDGGLLVDPPAGSVPAMLCDNVVAPGSVELRFSGTQRRAAARAGAPRGDRPGG